MLPIFSLQDDEFSPLVCSIASLFHKKYIKTPKNIRLILLCGKALTPNETKLSLFGKFLEYITKSNHSQQGYTNREILINYSKKNAPTQRYLLAERILHTDINKSGLDLLRGEDYIAQIVDCIVLFVESWGTAAELGAFALKNSLCKKMLVINDISHKHSTSFISQGPIKLVDRKSDYPVYYCDINNINNEIPEIMKCIESVQLNPSTRLHLPNTDYVNIQSKNYLLLLCDLIRIIEPASIASVEKISRAVFGNKIRTNDLYGILKIGLSAGLINRSSYAGHNVYFIPKHIKSQSYYTNIDSDEVNEIRLKLAEIIRSESPDFLEIWNAGLS